MESEAVSQVTIRRRPAQPGQSDQNELAFGPQSPEVHDHPLVSRLLVARGIQNKDELGFALSDLPRPDTLLGIEQAVIRIATAIQQQQKIIVIGDYDCDGATSTALALSALGMMGAKDIDFRVPNRFKYGYGLSPAIVDRVASKNPDLIITVDNGVASLEGVERATELGIDVVITDHHLPPAVLPRAFAIVNPNIPGSTFPSKNLAGVGVIYYVMIALRKTLKELNWFESNNIEEPRLASLLDLVALGTVADVVQLDHVNRTLVEQGLRRIRAGHTRFGITAICEIAGRQLDALAAPDLGFALGPRLNAAGRLDDISIGIRCLLADNPNEAKALASELDSLNRERQALEATMRAEAEALVEQQLDGLNADGQCQMLSICLFEEHWHEGVIGIVAGRLKERLQLPAVVFGSSGDGLIKGSGRSIQALHLRDAFQETSNRMSSDIEKFGGHAMAAGLTLKQSEFAEFKLHFQQVVEDKLGGVAPGLEFETDGSLQLHDYDLELAQLLKYVAPWGQGFPEPVFDGVFRVLQSNVLKDKHQKLRVTPIIFTEGESDSGSDSPMDKSVLRQSQHPQASPELDAISFNQRYSVQPGDEIRLVFRMSVNEWRNRRSLQLLVLHAQL